MRNLAAAAVTLIIFVEQGFALRCWTCESSLTNDECNIKGSIRTCNFNEACVNRESTSVDGSRYQITKGCRRKNTAVCRQNDPQNRGTYRTVCNQLSKSTVCSCCCENNLCNGPQTECKDMVTCRRPDRPGNGRVRCESPITFGSTCTVECDKGFLLNGPNKITCTNSTGQGYWSPRDSIACLPVQRRPETRQVRCKDEMTAPDHGSMVCENPDSSKEEVTYNYVGTVCAFKCDAGYFRTGSETTHCLPGGSWNTRVPKCQKGRCPRPPVDRNRINECSNARYIGSVCFIRCKPGYNLIGESTVTCNSVNDFMRQGAWSIGFPRCVRAVCRPQLTPPTDGAITCSKRNLLSSICTFSCRDGFELTETELTINGVIECARNGKQVEWNGSPPSCKRLMCPRPDPPKNGFVTCSGDGRVGTKCSFSCNSGYDLVGTASASTESECIRTLVDGFAEAVMTVQSVTCAEIRCIPRMAAPIHGNVFCTRDNQKGSMCTFTCKPGYDMDGTTATTVVNRCRKDNTGDGMGKWSVEVQPSCSSKYCPVPQYAPDNGDVTCTDESNLNSVCEFSCNEGFQLRGSSRTTCLELNFDGDVEVEWTNPSPVCVANTCVAQWYDKTNVKVRCNREKENNEYPVGTTCTYECEDSRYYVKADSGNKIQTEIRCLAKNRWSAPSTPTCVVKSCPQLLGIDNADQPKCSDGNRISSVCRYQCHAKYRLSHNSAITCVEGKSEEGLWMPGPPSCIPSECTVQPSAPNKGKVRCPEGTKIGSSCTLTCSAGYAPVLAQVYCETLPQRINGIAVERPGYSGLENFCCAECKIRYRVTLAVDLRSERSLQAAINFVKIYLSSLAGRKDGISFSTYAYNEQVVSSSLVETTVIVNSKSINDVIKQMEQWNVEEDGETSDAAAALRHATENMFNNADADDAKFLIIMADDSPDNVRRSLVRQISEERINIIVGARNNFAKIKWEKLTNGENVVNFDSNQILRRMEEVAFQGGCPDIAEVCV